MKIHNYNSLIILIIPFMLIVGCHNNAHLRTQKILKPKEKVYSLNGILPIGGIDEENQLLLDNTGIAGLRGELSMLKSSGTFEFGPYIGMGANFNDEEFGLILGLDYRAYSDLKGNLPKKIGSKLEFNFSSNGYVLSLNPNFTTVTNSKRPSYYGFHGLLSNGNLNEWEILQFRSPETDGTHDSYWDSLYYFHDFDQEYNYNFTSFGAGVTYGYEFFNSKKHSFQIQLDISLVKNNFKDIKELISFNTELKDFEVYGGNDDWFKYSEWDKSNDSDPTLIISLSAGMNFFKSDFKNRSSFEPMPSPQRSINQSIYDPDTGELIISGDSKFDPETGELIENQTGLQLSDNFQSKNYTDNEIINEAKLLANKSHNKDLHNIAGVGSCITAPFWGISLLASVVYMNTNILSTFDSYNSFYESLNSSQKTIFKSAYKIEERKLRKKNITIAQKSCFGLWVGSIVIIMIMEGD